MMKPGQVKGLRSSWERYAEIRAARFEDYAFLREQGATHAEAARRAGWPTLGAAEIAFRREGHPDWIHLSREIARRRREQARAA